MSAPSEITTPSDREILIARTFDAPPELVWRAWTDPELIVKWWGPEGFTTTNHTMDVRPGGIWRFDMHAPDGRTYTNRVVFDEVLAHERITYAHAAGDDAVRFRSEVHFQRRAAQTHLTLRMIFPSAEERERVAREYGAVRGGVGTLARLGDHLAAQQGQGAPRAVTIALPSPRETVITRAFDAPRLLVWRAMTTPELLARWLGAPGGYELIACEEDHRPGGAFRWTWRGPDGEITMHGVYREVEPPRAGGAGGRAVRTEIFDLGTQPSNQPSNQPNTEPANQLADQIATLELTEAGPSRTLVTLTLFYPSQNARDAAITAGDPEGLAEGYARLDDVLSKGIDFKNTEPRQ